MNSNLNNLHFNSKLKIPHHSHLSFSFKSALFVFGIIFLFIAIFLISYFQSPSHTASTNTTSQSNHSTPLHSSKALLLNKKFHLNEKGYQPTLSTELYPFSLDHFYNYKCITTSEAKLTIQHPMTAVKCVELTGVDNKIKDFSIKISKGVVKYLDVHLYEIVWLSNIRTLNYDNVYKYNNSIRICSDNFKVLNNIEKKDKIIMEILWDENKEKSFCFEKFTLI